MPNQTASDALAEAFGLLRAGRLDAAAAAVRDLLARSPRDPRVHALDARLRALQGDLEGADAAAARALALDPRCAPALVERASLARAAGDAAGAAAALQDLVAVAPRQPAFWYDLGVLRTELGQPEAASAAFAQTLALAPDHADAWFRRAAIDAAAGRHAAAVEGWRRCLVLRPGWPAALHNLGESLLAQDHAAEALAAWQEASRASPGDARIWDGMARAAKRVHDIPALLAARERCAEIDGGPVGWSLLGRECVGAGDLPAARRAFARSLAADPGYLAARWALFQYPADAVRDDEAAEAAFRTQWLDGLAAFEQEPLERRRAEELIACITLATEFEVHYLGEAMVDAQRRYGALLERMMALAFADRPRPPTRARTDGRRRIGFCSSMMRTHTVTKLFAALTGALDRTRWEVCCFHPADLENAGTEAWRRHADVYVGGEHDLGWWVDTLRAQELDALVFPDIGMHPFVQGLASMRFAPLQAMLWGHPQTSGRSTIDWFLTADAMEAADGARHYSERLHRLPGLGTAYAPPTLQPVPPPEFAARDADGLHCFVAQQAVKLRPPHDDVFARIAAALPKVRLHFVPSPSATVRSALHARLVARFAAAGLDFERHRGMFRFVSEAEFLAIGAGCDLNLDSIGWSGGNTTLEILWHGTPTVTLPGELMRSRHTMAMLRLLELPQLIARDVDDYVRIVVELGGSRELRAELRGTILERRHRLYEDPRVGPAFAAFVEETARG